MRAACAIALCCAACIAPASGAQAAAWLPLSDLASGIILYETAAMTPQGETIAAWRVNTNGQWKIQTSVRPAGGSFSPAADLTPFGKIVENIDVTADPAGNAIVTWRQEVAGTDIRLFYSYRPAGGGFTAPREVAGAGKHVAQPTTAMDAAGNAITVFIRAPSGDFHVAYVFRPAGGEYGEQQEITSNEATSPAVEFAGDGTAIAAWVKEPGGNVESARRPPGGEFGSIQPVSVGISNVLRLAVGSNGRALLGWQRYNGANTIVEGTLAEPGGNFGPAVPLSSPGVSSGQPRVAVDPAGSTLLAWNDGGGGDSLRVSAAAPGGPFGAAAPPAGASGYPTALEFAGDGSLMMIWAGEASPFTTTAAPRTPAGVFGTATLINQPGENSSSRDLTGDGKGDFLALYSRDDGGPNSTLRAVGYDGVPPAFRSLSVPRKAKTGKAASFSADVFDVWGAAVEWKFGDGRSAKGAAVKHTFRDTGGKRTIVVTATDPAGQSSTERRTINVKDVTPVVISRVRFKPPAFAAKGAAGAHGARVRKGSNLRFRLSERARVRIAFEGARRIRHRTRYVRLRSAKVLKRKGKKGGNRVRFTGKPGAKLAAGKYRAVLVATDTGGLRSKTKYARFRIVGP